MQDIINISNMKDFREKHPVGRRFFTGGGAGGFVDGLGIFPGKKRGGKGEEEGDVNVGEYVGGIWIKGLALRCKIKSDDRLAEGLQIEGAGDCF